MKAPITIRQLEYFCRLAETGNFTKTAKEEYVAQTAISQQIKALEENLGVKLFERDSHSVTITVAGREFYKDIVKILGMLMDSVDKVREIAQKESENTGYLTIGYNGQIRGMLTSNIINVLYLDEHSLEITLKWVNNMPFGVGMESRDLDILIALSLGEESNPRYPQIKSRLLKESRWCVVVGPTHRFADRKLIKRIDVADEKIVMLNPELTGELMKEYTQEKCVKSGFKPNFMYFDTLDEAYQMMEAGRCIGFYPDVNQKKGEQLVYIPMDGDDEIVNVVVRWNVNTINKEVEPALEKIIRVSESTS